MAKKSFPLSKVYRLLEPGPVVLVTTANKNRANIMTMSWHTMMDFEPPIVGCVISKRNYTFNILKATRERDQHSNGGAGRKGSGLRKHLRTTGR